MPRPPLSRAGSLAALFLALAGLAQASCGGTPPNDCPEGSADCPCAEGTCESGLECREGTCQSEAGSGGTGTDGSGGAASGGTSSGGTSSGGQSASACSGTATGSCDDPLCDTFPGCNGTQASACAGVEAACSSFDGDMPGCNAQWGCEPSVSGLCAGYDDPECEWAQNEAACANLECYWTGADCIGVIYEPPNCAGYSTESACTASPACYWTAADIDYCEGRATLCETTPPYRCELQAGCEVEPASCTGTPTPCADLDSASCLNQPGCLWNGEGRTDTPTGSSVTLADFTFVEATVGRAIEADLDYLHVELTIENRGPRAGTAHAVQIVLSEDESYDSTEDSVIHEIGADTEMDPFGFLPLGWTGDLPMLDISADHPDGEYTVFLVIDPEDLTNEAEEANNVWAQAEVFIGPTTFDLVLADASHDGSATLAPEDVVTLSLDVENASTTDVGTVPVSVVLSADEDLDVGDTGVDCEPTLTLDLASGAAGTFELDCVLPRARGTYFLLAELDPGDTLADANREDNVLSAGELEIDAPAPDLVVTALDSDSSTYSWSASATLTGTIENTGADPAPASNVTFYLSENDTVDSSDLVLCTRPLAGIAAAGQLSFDEDCNLPAAAIGSYSLLAVVDPADAIYEADDTNNESAAAALTVNQPNFNLEAIYVQIPDFSSVAPGDQLVIGIRVDNPGTAEIPSYDIDFYVSTDTTVTTSDELFCFSDNRAALPGGGSLEAQIGCVTPTLPPGTYYLGAFFDPDDEVPETDESDNVVIADTDDPLTIEEP